ncbi:hypothetical protein F4781DRAFT_413626 [Annulohypoxylon bovei var. microspora]|nr:hypothetical protein F4781DRAFT_413626 [Annulohypoxylon bovei var. microspora]
MQFVHELSHAMDIGKNRGNPHRTSEAFYKDHYIAEHGYEIEMEIFGCEIRDCPETRYGEGGLSASLLINHVGQQFPSPLQEGYESDIEYNGKRAAANIPILGSLIPTFWISAMVCEKYWTDVVRRHGSRAFRPPVIFQFPIYHYWRNTKISYLTPRPLANPIFDIPELKPDYERWVTKWQERRWEWDAMRPWFNKERGSWQILPWSQFRPDIEDFLYHHTRRDLRPCRHIAQRMYEYWENRDHIADRDPVASLLRTISLLMLISLPKTPEQAGSGEIIKSVALWPSSVSEHVLWTDWKQDPADPLCGSTGNIELIRVESDMVKTLNVLMTPNGYYDLIALAETEFGKLEWILGGPLLWLRGVLDCLVTVKRERLASPLYSSWTSFPFTIPPYEPNWAKSLIPLNTRQYPLNPPYYIVTPWESAITAQFDYSPPSSPVPRPKSHFLGGVQPRSFDRSASHIARKRSHDEYLYISTVGNHRALDDAWVVEPDGTSGFDVFNISNTLKELGATENDYGAIVVVGPRGPTLIHGNGRAETIRGMFKVSIQPIGKLVQLRRIEEIAECNGQDGRPTWILWGPHVYDITNLSPQSPEEQMLLDHGAGGPIFNCLTRVNDRSSQLRTRLEPYKSGYLDTLLPNHIMRHFTPRMLRWYDSPGLGIYIALGGIVYDISDYLQFHPGGNRLLRQCTGRDATQKFEQYHHLTIMDSYEKMKVGRLVPEIEMKDMRENHVLVHDWIFDISTLAKDDPNLHQVLYPYAGVDTTDALAGQGAGSSALVTLFLQKKDLIVAGLAPGPLPDIPSGELQKHNDYLGAEGAFVSVDNLVYNVTDLIRYPEYYEWKIGPNWAGKELNFGNLGGWLRENFEARCIGKLVEGPAWAEPTADIDMRDAYPEPELRTYFI